MRRLVLLRAWLNKRSATVGIVVFVATLFWPSIPLRSVDLWLTTLRYSIFQLNHFLFLTTIFYPLLAFLAASYAAIYFYDKKVESCCQVSSIRKGTTGSLIGIFLGACPACVPAIAFFLPLSLTLTLSYLSPLFLMASIAVLLFAIHRMNGFKRIKGTMPA